MLFSGKKKTDTTKKSRIGRIGTLLKPNLGGSVRPAMESGKVFINLIAMIFAMNGLFPKNHPALTGREPDKRLTLTEVLNTAWSGLTFTREGMPKTLLFFAVVAAIVLTVLSVITALMLGLVSTAHAQTFFQPPNPTNDLALNWMKYLFDPANSATALANLSSATGNTAMPTTTIQKALITMLSFYSNAMLIVAAAILFYHLTAMTVETAHHGVVMGKRASQIWAPIRLVVAVGLLVPIGTGLNSGQFIVLKMAEWGSGMASQAWKIFVSQMAQDSTKIPAPTAADTRAIIDNLSMMYACEYAYNYQISKVQGFFDVAAVQNINEWTWNGGIPAAPPAANITTTSNGGEKHSFTNRIANDYDLCGSYTIPAKPTYQDPALNTMAQAIYTDYKAAFDTANGQAQVLGTKMFYLIPDLNSSTIAITPSMFDAPAAQYQAALQTALNSATSSNTLASAMSNLAQQSTNQGWIAAGAWFNKLSAMQAAIGDIAASSLPDTQLPQLGNNVTADTTERWFETSADKQRTQDIYKNTLLELSQYSQYADISTNTPAAAATPGTTGTKSDCHVIFNPVECILSIASMVAAHEGVWNQDATGLNIGIQFQGRNPLAEMAGFGHKLVSSAMDMFNIGIWLFAGSAVDTFIAGGFMHIAPVLGSVVKFIGGAAALVAPIFFFIGVLFLTMGMAIAYFLPFLPFMHFFFNTITWIAVVAEGVLGVPLVALAHLTPEGEGLPGPSAKGAYYMVFSIMLRPILMVFGLIAALLILFVACGLLNALYGVAVANTGDTGSGHTLFSRIVYTLLYVVMLYSIANHSFSLIGRFPNYAMEWMGGKGVSGEKMGEPGQIAGAASAVTGYFGTQAMGQVSQGLGKISQLDNQQGDKAKAKAEELGAQGYALKKGEVGPNGQISKGLSGYQSFMGGGAKGLESSHQKGLRSYNRDQEQLAAFRGSGGGNAGGNSNEPSAPTGGGPNYGALMTEGMSQSGRDAEATRLKEQISKGLSMAENAQTDATKAQTDTSKLADRTDNVESKVNNPQQGSGIISGPVDVRKTMSDYRNNRDKNDA